MRLKPFGFCCSVDRLDPLSKYDQQMPPYTSSLMAITSVHDCPVSKMRLEFIAPRLTREKKRPAKNRTSEVDKHQLSKNRRPNYLTTTDRNDRSMKWCLEDEIALAKDIFWTEKQRIYKEEGEKMIAIAKKKVNMADYFEQKYPRWYQDFSPDQIKNLMNLEDAMRTDYKERITSGTQMILITIGIISTFFKLQPNIIRKLHKSCNLNGVQFLREIYKLLTGNDFQEEEYKRSYNCNERIILSGIAFLTLPEIVEELHKRLPAISVPRLPPKPKLPLCPARRKNIYPYKEELFRAPDWISYKHNLQEWQKRIKLFAIPKVILPCKCYNQLLVDDKSSEISKKREKDIYNKHLEEITNKKLKKMTSNKCDPRDINMRITETSDIPRLPDEDKKFDFTIRDLGEKQSVVENKICGTLQQPDRKQRSWLNRKDVHYVVTGVSEDSPTCPVTYKIADVVNVSSSNSNEKFFEVLKLRDDRRRSFPAGRENLSKNWQEWLHNADEEFKHVENKADRLVEDIRAAMKPMLPEPICDDCCSCRQTTKTREKLRYTKTPHMLIDSVLQDKNENKYIVGSMAMHSPGPSPTESAVDLPETIASQDEIKTNVIINGVTGENGRTQYYISGVQKDKVHIPASRISAAPTPRSVKNVPPCACAIQKVFNENVSPSASKDFLKVGRLCPGKKYRPDEPGAYSCKMHPSDKSCKRNPFIKDVEKMWKEMKEKERKGDNERQNVVECTEVIGEQTEVSKNRITERKKDRFIPDPDYPAYDDPWNKARTAPSTIVKTDYEMSLKLTSPTLPAIPSPTRIQKQRKDILFSSKKPKPLQSREQETAIEEMDEEVSRKIPAPRKARREKSEEREDVKVRKNKKKIRISPKNIITSKKGVKLSGRVSKSAMRKMKKHKIKSPADKTTLKVRKTCKCQSSKKDRKKDAVKGKVDQLDDREREMARLKNMMKPIAKTLDDVRPAVLAEEPSAACRRELEEKSREIGDFPSPIDEGESRKAAEKGPCGWRTKSEQELPAKKTVAYLCEPDYPLETVAIRPGGRPCKCRENRGKKKILMYNVRGLVDEKRDGRRAKKRDGGTKPEAENRIIDGVYYCTPPVSPRRSDEYVPEYDLLQSPYDVCVGEATDEGLKLIERYSGPKDLTEKIRREPKPCSVYMNQTGVAKEDGLISRKEELDEARRMMMESKSPEERWALALKDAELTDYFTQRRGNAPCWTSDAKHSRSTRARRLKMQKPVCECKYERKILERNEDRASWRKRQQKLKAFKKQPVAHVADISGPMVPDPKLIISDVKRIPREDEYVDDVSYCVTGVAENLSMSPPQRIIGGLTMSTPFETPKTSEEDITRTAVHRHWSPTDIPPGPLPRKDAALKAEMKRRRKVTDEAFRLIYDEDRDCQGPCQAEPAKKVEKNRGTKKSNASTKSKVSEVTAPDLSSARKVNGKAERQRSVPCKEIASEITCGKEKYPEKIIGGTDHKQIVEEPVKETGDWNYQAEDDDKKYQTSNLTAIVKAELEKMAAEGYVFAKLPKCYLMPQLQDWIMYRKGVAFSKTDKKNMMITTVGLWQLVETLYKPKMKVPKLHINQNQLKRLTYDRAKEMKNKIKRVKAIFYSNMRKSRVAYSRLMWNTMEFGKFPSASFKRAFFTYMASKETDGHVFKPWLYFEVPERGQYISE